MSWVTVGGGPLGNLFREVDEVDAEATVARAWERGVRSFDTAPHYGLGLSERRMGHLLGTFPRDEFQLSTKVGRLIVPDSEGSGTPRDAEGFAVPGGFHRQWSFTAEGVLRSLDDSLDRLALDRIDVVYLHDPDDHLDDAADLAFPALARLRDEGVIKAVGVGTNRNDVAIEVIRRCAVDVVMIAGRLTLLDQTAADELLPICRQRSIAVVAAGVFNSGVLADAVPDERSRFDYQGVPASALERARRIADVCAAHGRSMRAMALALPGRYPAVSALCFGARSAAEVEANLDDLDEPVDDDLWLELASLDLLDGRGDGSFYH